MEQQNSNENGKLEQRIEHIMISKIQLLVATMVFIVPIIAFFFKIQLDVALIKQNHEVHIEQILEEIKTLNDRMDKRDVNEEAQNKGLIRLMTIHNLIE